MGKDCRRERDFRIKNFPDNIRDLLCMLAKEDENRVTVVLSTCEDCIAENVEIVAVIGHLAVFRCHDKFKFVDVRCICEVIVDCDVILNEILDNSSHCHC